MTPRRIVRNDSVMGGRWHFEGTDIAITAVRADAIAGVGNLAHICQRTGLTEEEIMLALGFEFPEVRAPQLWSQYAAVTIACSCGEESHATFSGFDRRDILCACGRVWCLRLTLDADVHRAD
ncbi:MAG TPA: hypothetical protein VHR64_14260 [Thermomicrobiales bacterium]|nr:hypothetical protein [Thermomicrobiales bacterium]